MGGGREGGRGCNDELFSAIIQYYDVYRLRRPEDNEDLPAILG
jgi:hypothetical protein